jgi:hypothetical protein
MKIIFTDVYNLGDVLDKPKPANKFIPEWYKKIDSYFENIKIPTDDGLTSATVKKCIPVFDAITTGYIITSSADLYVEKKENGLFYKWSGFDLIQFHPPFQTVGHPAKINDDENSTPKFMNPWAIETPKGYSVLIIQPMHREAPFTILPAIVDTDNYKAPINFPFVMNDKNWEGLVPAGTPIAQIIPFKREQWKMEFGKEKELDEINKIQKKLNVAFWDRYKRFYWHRKEYK